MYVASEIEINIRLKKTSVLRKYCRASWSLVLQLSVLKFPSHLNLYGRCPHERATEATERVATDYPVWCFVTFHYTLGQSLTLIYYRFSCYVLFYRKSFGINETFFFITSKSLHVSLFHWRVLTAYFVSNFKGTVCRFMSSSAHILDCPALIRSPSFSQACRVDCRAEWLLHKSKFFFAAFKQNKVIHGFFECQSLFLDVCGMIRWSPAQF